MSGSTTAEQKLNYILAQEGSISTQEGAQEFVDTVSAILDSDKDLGIELKNKASTKLRKTCGHYRIVPKSYVLTGVEKDGNLPPKDGITAETWRGSYKTKAVAIKVFKEHEDHDKTKARFCKEAVLWKRLAHKNVLPFLGISKDVGEFCWISPWMKNGTILEYIRDNSQINTLELLKDAASGLNFLHANHLVHGDLRAEHILIGDDGQACIANTGHSRIVSTALATSETSLDTVALEEFRWRWSAPELQQPGAYGIQKATATKASDIYGMGMVIYEVLTREVPFSGCTDDQVLAEVQDGKRPPRPTSTTSPGITNPIWMLLGQCWDWKPDCRPNSTHVLNIIRENCRFGDTNAAIPRQLKLKMKGIVTDWKTEGSINPYVILQYGPLVHATSRAAAAGRNKYVWDEHEAWSVGLEEQYGHQMVTVQLFHRGSIPFKRRKLLGTGKLFLSTTSMDISAEIDGELAKGLNGARVNMQIMALLT